jgi:hypothetical protein
MEFAQSLDLHILEGPMIEEMDGVLKNALANKIVEIDKREFLFY